MPQKPELRSEDDARAAVEAWRGRPEHTRPRPGQAEKTASDDYNDRAHHHEPKPVQVTDSPEEV
jgi:hypothetical protein